MVKKIGCRGDVDEMVLLELPGNFLYMNTNARATAAAEGFCGVLGDGVPCARKTFYSSTPNDF